MPDGSHQGPVLGKRAGQIDGFFPEPEPLRRSAARDHQHVVLGRVDFRDRHVRIDRIPVQARGRLVVGCTGHRDRDTFFPESVVGGEELHVLKAFSNQKEGFHAR
jgi:hypothetical protein